MRSSGLFFKLFLTLAVLPLSMAVAASKTETLKGPKGVKPTQAEVLRKIHLTNLMEVKVGEMAQQKGMSQAVKDFGAKLVQDHTDADAKVLATANAVKVNLNAEVASIDPKMKEHEKAVMEKLQAANGAEFDRVFGEEMHAGHADTIKHLIEAKAELKGTKTAQLIDELLPTLRNHDASAMQIAPKAE